MSGKFWAIRGWDRLRGFGVGVQNVCSIFEIRGNQKWVFDCPTSDWMQHSKTTSKLVLPFRKCLGDTSALISEWRGQWSYQLSRPNVQPHTRKTEHGSISWSNTTKPLRSRNPVQSAEPKLCAQYLARIFENIRETPSQNIRQLDICGLRQITLWREVWITDYF